MFVLKNVNKFIVVGLTFWICFLLWHKLWVPDMLWFSKWREITSNWQKSIPVIISLLICHVFTVTEENDRFNFANEEYLPRYSTKSHGYAVVICKCFISINIFIKRLCLAYQDCSVQNVWARLSADLQKSAWSKWAPGRRGFGKGGNKVFCPCIKAHVLIFLH